MTKRRASAIFWTIITSIPLVGVVWGIYEPIGYASLQKSVGSYLAPLGLFGPIAFVLLQALQVVVTPVSHYAVGLLGGFLYGFAWGGLLNYIGRIAGHVAAYLLADRARGFVEKRGWVTRETLALYDRIFRGTEKQRIFSYQTLILFLIYFLPLFPDDEISYLVGFAKMPLKPFLLANLFGHLGGSFSLALLGAGLDTRDPWFWTLTILTLVGFPLIWFLYRRSGKNDANG